MKEIVFEKQFDAIVALNSELPRRDEMEALLGVPIVSADGACLGLADMGIRSDYIVGDLDSLRASGRVGEFDSSEIIEISDQETNDFEKALSFAIGKGWRSVLVIGFHGGELEHTLNNISVFKKYARRIGMCLYERGRYAVFADTSFALATVADETISLLPLPSAMVSTKGLRWSLEKETLEMGSREGARNRAQGCRVSVEIHSGSLAIFFASRLPYMPKFV